MCRPNTECATRRRGGFTLWELALALAVVAMVVGLTWPAVMRFVGEQRLKDDTAAVRTQMATTRSRSIQHGITFQFRYEPGGRQFVILPYERPLAMAAASVDDADGAAGALDPGVKVLALQLAEGNRFEAYDPQAGSALQTGLVTERLTEEWLQLFGGNSALARINWSPPVLFEPDGTSEDVTFFVIDEEGRYQQITVRGLTADVRIGPIQKEREF